MVVIMPHLCELHPLEVVQTLPKDTTLRVNIMEELCKPEKRSFGGGAYEEMLY